jgi:prevent-host-death family protein
MKRVFTVHAAKTNLSRLIERARAGEEVIIARGKTPVVRLVPVSAPKPRRRFGAMRGKAGTTRAFFEPLSADELMAWTGSDDE